MSNEENLTQDCPDDEQWEWECAYPDECLAISIPHHRSECCTTGDMEAYNADSAGVPDEQSAT